MSKSNEKLSLKTEIKLYGVTIKKMPNGIYFNALQTLKDLPKEFIKSLNLNEEFKLSELLDLKNIGDLIVKLLIVLPDFTIKFLSELMDIDEEKLINELSPVETIEIFKKFWEINRLNDFFELMKPMTQKIMENLTKIGFSEQ